MKFKVLRNELGEFKLQIKETFVSSWKDSHDGVKYFGNEWITVTEFGSFFKRKNKNENRGNRFRRTVVKDKGTGSVD